MCEVRMPQQTKSGERKARSNKERQQLVWPTESMMKTSVDGRYEGLELRARVERHSAPRRDRGGDLAAANGKAVSWKQIQSQPATRKEKKMGVYRNL